MHTCINLLTEESASTEPAWKNAGQKPGMQIWRIVVSIIYWDDFAVREVTYFMIILQTNSTNTSLQRSQIYSEGVADLFRRRGRFGDKFLRASGSGQVQDWSPCRTLLMLLDIVTSFCSRQRKKERYNLNNISKRLGYELQ